MNIIFLVLAILLFISGLFNKIEWKFNIPALIVLFFVWLITMYNQLVAFRNRVKEAWADIETQLKRRYDLIPNLVDTIKGYTKHESTVFDNITKARTMAINAKDMKGHSEAENMLTGAMKSIFAVAEAYPDLKASPNFLALQNELSDTENKIQASRRFYNTNVRDFNIAIESFPNNIIASLFKFNTQELFDLADDHPAQEPVAVKF